MGTRKSLNDLSRRERQIMDVIYQLGQATANDVMDNIPDPPSNATVRKLLSILEEKGLLHHRVNGTRYVYLPTVPADRAKASAMRHMLDTFFKGSAANAVIALLSSTPPFLFLGFGRNNAACK